MAERVVFPIGLPSTFLNDVKELSGGKSLGELCLEFKDTIPENFNLYIYTSITDVAGEGIKVFKHGTICIGELIEESCPSYFSAKEVINVEEFVIRNGEWVSMLLNVYENEYGLSGRGKLFGFIYRLYNIIDTAVSNGWL